MGVKDLWTLLTPYCERKPIYELQGKVVAIDLAGWVCESLCAVDYFVHPKQYLKNLFFRTCYLLLTGIVPIFVLEGKAPDIKQDTINKRNDIQFRGNKPRKENKDQPAFKASKGRTRFNHVLKECDNLLATIGLQCVQAPGEAEAFCAHLNRIGLVDGIISQDSDCFAYGAKRVYRNFSVCSQGKSAAQGGAVDIYDMEKICESMDFGQNKIIAMALLCGCDYSTGVDGVGRDAVVKLFARYKDCEILDRIKSWRQNNNKFTEIEMKVNNKSLCSECGHHGIKISHTKSGCNLCRTTKGCDGSKWKEERLAIKSELAMRKKALLIEEFPSQAIIDEFLGCPPNMPKLDLQWKQPKLVKFVKTFGNLLQWTEVYSFQKFLPLVARWLTFNYRDRNESIASYRIFSPDFIRKKRTPKGIPSFEVIWKDNEKCVEILIPGEQLQAFSNENSKGLEALLTTIEPVNLMEDAYPAIVEEFLAKQKKPKMPKSRSKNFTKLPKVLEKGKSKKTKGMKSSTNDSLSNMNDMIEATENVGKTLKRKKNDENVQKIDKFLVHRSTSTNLNRIHRNLNDNCSTPKATKAVCLSDLEDDCEDIFNASELIKNIVLKPSNLQEFDGKKLKYDEIKYSNRSFDDLDLLPNLKRSFKSNSPWKTMKRSLLSREGFRLNFETEGQGVASANTSLQSIENIVDRFLTREGLSTKEKSGTCRNVSYFFEESLSGVDEFEKSLEVNLIETESDELSPTSDSDCFILD